MDFENLNHYNEQDFWNDQMAVEKDYRDDFERGLEDPHYTEPGFDVARAEAAAAYQWPQTCDGSGIIEERYTGADESEVYPCQGCPACQLQPVELAPLPSGPEPEWMRESELVEFGVRRKPAAAAETSTGAPAIEKEVA